MIADRKILILCPIGTKTFLQPLVSIWKQKGFSPGYLLYAKNQFPNVSAIESWARGFTHIVCIYHSRVNAAAALNKPAIYSGKKWIPIWLIPYTSITGLQAYINTACLVHNTHTQPAPITLLAQRHQRFLTLSKKVSNSISNSMGVISWTGDVVYAGDMIRGINSGAGICLYMGHGREIGWSGYYGVRIQHFNEYKNKPATAIFSLSCLTACRGKEALSFCEELICRGFAVCTLGAVTHTLFTHNARWAVSMGNALQIPHASMGDFMVKSLPVNKNALTHYRFFGDPTIQLGCHPNFIAQSATVITYE